MFKTRTVSINDRVVVLKNGVPVRVLGPGKHRLWGGGLSFMRLDVTALVFDLPAEVRAILSTDTFEAATIGPSQRAILYRNEKPEVFLGPGIHHFWTVDPGVSLRVMSIDEDVPELTDDELALIPNREMCAETIQQYQRGLLYVQGRFVKLLDAGRYAMWSTANAKVAIQVLDTRLRQATIAGQDLMTRDKVTLRLTLTAEYTPSDAEALVHAVADVEASIYLIVQLAARDYVAGVTLDELLEGRDAMAQYLFANTVGRARELGVEVHRVGVKDIVLPGEMKLLLNRVIEAEKEAAAKVIHRRDEVAASRTMANAAKVMAENPMIFKLKQLEALVQIAGGIDEVRLFVGQDGLELLAPKDENVQTKN